MNTMNPSPLVSVVIPTYNRGSIIGATLEDVFRQTYRNIEVILVDDASSDDTESQLGSYRERIRFFRLARNSGPGGARNKGVELAAGEIIAFQDSDDRWDPTKLERQVDLLQRAGQSVPCCLCNALLGSWRGAPRHSFDITGIHPGHSEGLWLNPAEVLANGGIFFNQAVAVRKAAFQKAGGFDPSLRCLEDWDLALRLALLGPFAYTAESLATWNPGSEMSLTAESLGHPIVMIENSIGLLEKVLGTLPDDAESRRIRKLLTVKLRACKRELNLLQGRQDASPVRRKAAVLMAYVERLRRGLYRRSPSFPRMVTSPLAESVTTYQETLAAR